HMLGQGPAECHADGAIDLAAALHRIDQATDIRRMNAVENSNLRRDPMHGKAHAMNVERRRAGREKGLSHRLEAMADLRARGMKIFERNPAIAAEDGAVLHPAGRTIDAAVAAG